MAFLCCNSRNNCSCTTIVASIVIGIITAILRFMAVITVTPAFLWVLFGIAVVYLAILPITAAIIRNSSSRTCVCPAITPLVAGILGTILVSVILLAIPFAATSLFGAIITGALLTFFSLTVTSTACLVKCAFGCSDRTCA